MDSLRIYFHLVLAYIRSRMEYRFAFWLNILTVALSYVALLATIWALLLRFQTIGDWDFREIAFLFALGIMVNGLSIAFFFELRIVSQLVRDGEMDRYLLRPLNPLLLVIGSGFEPMSVGHLIVGIGLFCWASAATGIAWTIPRLAYLLLILAGGTAIQGAIYLSMAAASFWILDSRSLWSIVANLREFMWFPLSIYLPLVQVILTFVIPLGFVNYYPACYFLGKPHTFLINQTAGLLTPFIGLVAFCVSYAFWARSIGHYQGTGS